MQTSSKMAPVQNWVMFNNQCYVNNNRVTMIYGLTLTASLREKNKTAVLMQ